MLDGSRACTDASLEFIGGQNEFWNSRDLHQPIASAILAADMGKQSVISSARMSRGVR
ncbi:hypothetical protein OG874_22545 [Nocardia sp. NBC_00565]|uniref:hypothetical protein n=1 Tax=Nocardia sp. NBC_00565 TaxID=2975993 RepID=UPI002E815816|nr:hypothetical protein [Nocardia sp. NBC_00565]WUC07697.1 hypothetical protein OG874_22545 [Nocardia sp. NBC_00565]